MICCNLHLVNPPQVVEHVDVDCTLPGATGHRAPASDTIGHQANQVVSPAELIPEMVNHLSIYSGWEFMKLDRLLPRG